MDHVYVQARVSKEKGVAAKALYKAPYINEITVAIQKHVVAVNKRLPRGFPTLKRFTVLRKQFSLERGTAAALIARPRARSDPDAVVCRVCRVSCVRVRCVCFCQTS